MWLENRALELSGLSPVEGIVSQQKSAVQRSYKDDRVPARFTNVRKNFWSNLKKADGPRISSGNRATR